MVYLHTNGKTNIVQLRSLTCVENNARIIQHANQMRTDKHKWNELQENEVLD
jgi:hypothetical protein